MYPKVKVRVQDSDDHDEDLRFSWSQLSSPDEYLADSPKCVIRVPAAQIPKQLLNPTQEPKLVDQKGKKPDEANRLSTISSSVVRPRAVLSSPDNDEMIGGKNSKIPLKPSPLRNQNVNQHTQHKISPDNDKMIGGKNSKIPSQPSPLPNQNVNQHRLHKIIPIQTASGTPASMRNKPTCLVKNHTPSATENIYSRRGKANVVKDQNSCKCEKIWYCSFKPESASQG